MVQPVAGAAASIAFGMQRRAAARLPAAEDAAQLFVPRAAAATAGAGCAARGEGAYEGELKQPGEDTPRVGRLRASGRARRSVLVCGGRAAACRRTQEWRDDPQSHACARSQETKTHPDEGVAKS